MKTIHQNLTGLLLVAISLFSQAAQAQLLLSQANTTGTYTDPVSITLKPGFSSTSFHALIQAAVIPLGSNPSSNQNYILTTTYLKPFDTAPTNPAVEDAKQTVQYFDGLGRLMQTVQVKGSPDAGKDIVTPVMYDAYGRQDKQYLPYPTASGAGGSFKPNAIADQATFYHAPTAGVVQIPAAGGITPSYSQTVYEPSPLNRVDQQGFPGSDWQPKNGAGGSGHTARTVYTTNNNDLLAEVATTRKAILYQVSLSSTGVPTLSIRTGTSYGTGQLYVTISRDENWDSTATGFNSRLHTTEEYTDKGGKVILKRTFNLNGSTQEMLSTYYVYDDFGNLGFVLPPGAKGDRASLPTGTALTTWLNTYCYQYRYDKRNRMSYKRVPGEDTWETYNYNQLDRLVFHQDNRQQLETYPGFTPGKYHTFYKYDALGRQIMTGVERNVAGTRDQIETIIDDWGYLWEERTTANGSHHGYTRQSIPTDTTYMEALEVNYYDSYDGIPGLPDNQSASYSKLTQGLLVASKAKVLGTGNTYLWTVNYYNDRGEVVKQYRQHYKGGIAGKNNYDEISNTYTFTGQLKTSTRRHYTGSSTAALQLTIATEYTYDHRNRLLDTKETISPGSGTAGTPTILSRNEYNEVGQLRVKRLHSTNSGSSFADSVKYAYNARGWLKESISPKFKETLNYQEAGTGISPQWNGNISRQHWQQGTATAQDYFYTYDAVNRLTQGNMAGNLGRETLAYDSVGNIKTLVRTGTSSTVVDQLTYKYASGGNRLTSLVDANTSTNAAYQLPGTTTYGYDANGNMKSRVNSGSTAHNISSMAYNYLNLPQTVTLPSGTITYTYDGTGRKLRTVGGGITTEYIDGIEWQGGTLNLVHTDEGRAVNTGSGYGYEYFLKDHLGNTRSGFAASAPATVKFVTEYYPFGLTYSAGVVPSPKNRYLYNGKELQDGSNLYDYGARLYDPVIGRWGSLDSQAEKMPQWSDYSFSFNNPIVFLDPDGQKPIPVSSTAFRLFAQRQGVNGNQQIGAYFERLAIASLQTTLPVIHNTNINFYSSYRQRANAGLPNSVRPDGISMYGGASSYGETAIMPSFYEAKATSATITKSYRKSQITGMLDVLSGIIKKDGRDHVFGALTLVTTADTKISNDILQYASERNIEIFQSIGAIDDETGEFILGERKLLNGNPISEIIDMIGKLNGNYDEFKGIDPRQYLIDQSNKNLSNDPDPAQLNDR